MIKNKKLLLNLSLSIVAVLPLASVISCGKSNSNYSKSSSKSNHSNSESGSNKTNSPSNGFVTNKSDPKADDYSSDKSNINSKNEPDIKNNDLQTVINTINKNIINKEIARWIKPSDITDEILLRGTLLQDKLTWTLYITKQYKFNNIKIISYDDDKGTATLSYNLTDNEDKNHTFNHTFEGFLTTEQEKINNKFKSILNDLKINKDNSGILFFVKDELSLNEKDIEQNKNKNLKDILSKVEDSDQKNKLLKYLDEKKIIEDSIPTIYKMAGLEIPTLIFNAYINENNKKSSIFSIVIENLNIKLNEDRIKKIIDSSYFLNHEAFETFPSIINDQNYINYIETDFAKHLIANQYINSDKIKLEVKNIREKNDLNGSLKADIYVKSTDNSIKNFKYTTTLYGFKIKN